MDSTLTNGSFNFLVDSQQLEYQKDKSILHMLKNRTKIKGGNKYDMSCMPGKLEMSTIRCANLKKQIS